jgi:hypothetical protein
MNELKLCPDCPARWLIPEVIKELEAKALIKTGEKPSALKICMEIRRKFRCCPYYSNTETLLMWLQAKPTAYNGEG